MKINAEAKATNKIIMNLLFNLLLDSLLFKLAFDFKKRIIGTVKIPEITPEFMANTANPARSYAPLATSKYILSRRLLSPRVDMSRTMFPSQDRIGFIMISHKPEPREPISKVPSNHRALYIVTGKQIGRAHV